MHLRTGTVHIAATDKIINYNGRGYISVPIKRESIQKSVDNVDNDVELKIADADNDKLAYLVNGFDFRGCVVEVRQILYPDSLENPDIVRYCFWGYIDEPCYDNGEFTFKVKCRLPKLKVPRRSCGMNCNSQFGDTLCGVSKDSQECYIYGWNETQNDIKISISRDNDYWRDGVLVIDGESKPIMSNDGATIKVYYPFKQKLESGKKCYIERGCDRTKTTCQTRFNNLSHFSGFPAIPFETIYR